MDRDVDALPNPQYNENSLRSRTEIKISHDYWKQYIMSLVSKNNSRNTMLCHTKCQLFFNRLVKMK